jgi:hypothetical protein
MKSILIFSILFFTNSLAQSGDTLQIYSSFNSFLEYTKSRNGTEAIKYIDSSSIEYYYRIKGKSLFAEKTQINQLSFTDKLLALTIRGNYNADEIEKLPPDKFFIKLVEDGIIGRGKLKSFNYPVSITGNKANLYLDSTAVGTNDFLLQFTKEDGLWKLNIPSMLIAGNSFIEERIKLNNTSDKEVNAMLKAVLMLTLKEDSVDYLWEPLIK